MFNTLINILINILIPTNAGYLSTICRYLFMIYPYEQMLRMLLRKVKQLIQF